MQILLLEEFYSVVPLKVNKGLEVIFYIIVLLLYDMTFYLKLKYDTKLLFDAWEVT